MFKITVKRTAIILAILAIIGSIVIFHATNLVLASILNKGCPFLEFFVTLFPSLTFLMVALDFILFMFFFLRLYFHPTHEQRMLKVYGIILFSFSLFGFLNNTLSGAITYKGNFLVTHPFSGFHIIMYLFHIAMLVLSCFMFFYFPKKIKNDDIIIHRTNTAYVFKTILISLILFESLNRFGGFILLPTYVQWSTLYLTYPAYIALILPIAILAVILIYTFGGFNKYPMSGIVASSFILVLSLFFCGQIIYRGRMSQLFVQLCSPVNPIGRLLTFPIDALLQALTASGLALFTLINSIYFKRISDYNKLPYEMRMAIKQGREANFRKPEIEKDKGE